MANPRTVRRRKRLTTPQTRWPGLLIGADMIRAYLGDIGRDTLRRWHKLYRLPLAHTPDGQLLSATSAIDAWIDEAIKTEMATPLDRTGWTAFQHGCYSGLRLAHDPDGHRLADDLASKRKSLTLPS